MMIAAVDGYAPHLRIAGSTTRPHHDVPLTSPVNVLLSFHYYRSTDIADMRSWGLRIIGDSGAFSATTQDAHIDLDEYAAWVTRWRGSLLWAASLDVIGDADASWANYQALTAAGIDTVPTVHYGEPPATLDKYADADLVGLGGMVPFKSEPRRLMRWCLSMFRHARAHHPHMRFHGWGITHPLLMDNLPWWSVDSSGFSQSYRFGRMALFDPSRRKRLSYEMDGRGAARHARLLRDVYGIDWRRVAESTPATRRDVVRVSVRTVQLVEAWLSSRHRVAPPASLTGPPGPQIAAVLGAPAMQPSKSLSPDDNGPTIYAVNSGGDQDLRSMT